MARRKTPAPAETAPQSQADAPPAPAPARGRLHPLPIGPTVWAPAIRVAPAPIALDATIDAEFSATQIRELARTLGVALRGTSKTGFIEQTAAELRARMARATRDPELLLEGLDVDQAAFVRRALTARDHTLPFPRGLAATLAARSTGSIQDAERRLTELLEGLRRRALIFPSRFTYFGTYRDIFYQWPPMSEDALVPVLEWRRPAARPGKDASRGAASTFLSDMDQVLDAVFALPLELRPTLAPHLNAARTPWLRKWEHDAVEVDKLLRSRAGWAPDPRAGVRVIADDLVGQSGGARLNGQTGLAPEQCAFLVSLAAGLNLITAPAPATAPRISAIRPQQYETWLSLSDEDKLIEAWSCWTTSLALGIEAAQAGVSAYRAVGATDLEPAHLGSEWCGLRRYMTRVLRGIPDGLLTDWPTLRRALWEFHPSCANAFLGRDVVWLASHDGQRADVAKYDAWAASVGAVFEAMLLGPLTWFGAIEPVLQNGALLAFTVTETGRWLIDQRWIEGAALPSAARPAKRRSESVAWSSAEEWRMPPAPERAPYLGFARLIAEPAEAPFTYRITTASLERALTAGLGPAEAVERFAALGAPMPAKTRRRFQALAERFGRIRAYESVSVLTLGDDLALRELLASTSLREAILYEISPRAVVVRTEAIDALIEELTTKGFTPGVKA